MLYINSISKKFNKKQILDGVSLQVEPGRIAVLLGGSGVGKSTIIRILAGLEQIDSGTILLDEQPLQAQDVGMVFQDFNLFNHLTIEQNVTLPLEIVHQMPRDQARSVAHDLLDSYGLADKKDKYPHHLSGGQKQRVALARALAVHPKVLCLDEPTSALDPSLTLSVAKQINELREKNMCIIISTHDVQLIQSLDCVIYLVHEGKIIEKADSKDFQKNIEQFPSIKKFMYGQVA
ncbi:amino acid ABC transporter ATP-binding protein [bacterium]|jgi:polar amino acid transport system ATP-binding protein|nr:amino acid ABC transporter ATP-binding protein [bacterium]NBX77939.1 amino acid ABC transporter ATP-binding protein [bacterium]